MRHSKRDVNIMLRLRSPANRLMQYQLRVKSEMRKIIKVKERV